MSGATGPRFDTMASPKRRTESTLNAMSMAGLGSWHWCLVPNRLALRYLSSDPSRRGLPSLDRGFQIPRPLRRSGLRIRDGGNSEGKPRVREAMGPRAKLSLCWMVAHSPVNLYLPSQLVVCNGDGAEKPQKSTHPLGPARHKGIEMSCQAENTAFVSRRASPSTFLP